MSVQLSTPSFDVCLRDITLQEQVKSSGMESTGHMHSCQSQSRFSFGFFEYFRKSLGGQTTD